MLGNLTQILENSGLDPVAAESSRIESSRVWGNFTRILNNSGLDPLAVQSSPVQSSPVQSRPIRDNSTQTPGRSARVLDKSTWALLVSTRLGSWARKVDKAALLVSFDKATLALSLSLARLTGRTFAVLSFSRCGLGATRQSARRRRRRRIDQSINQSINRWMDGWMDGLD